MPVLSNCPRCKALFPRGDALVCEKCLPEEEADQAKVRTVMAEQEGLSAAKLAYAAKVPVACVTRMLEGGQIEQAAGPGAVLCGRCGAPAENNRRRLCRSCLIKLDQECNQAIADVGAKVYKPVGRAKVNRVHDALGQKREARRGRG